MRIGSGEYERRGYRNKYRPEARMFFFKLLLTTEPDVASSLYSGPYEYYKSFFEAANQAGCISGLWWKLISSDQDFQILNEKEIALFKSFEQQLAGLRIALLKWAKRWNLRAHWCLDEALRALEAYSITEFYYKRWDNDEGEARDWFFSNNIIKDILADKGLDFFCESDDLDHYAMFSPWRVPNFEICKNYYPYLEPPYPLPIWLPALQYRKNYLKAVLIQLGSPARGVSCRALWRRSRMKMGSAAL